MEQPAESDKEVVPEADRNKPVFSAGQLRVCHHAHLKTSDETSLTAGLQR